MFVEVFMFETSPVGSTRFKPVKNLVYQIGRQCYKNKITRTAFDIASFGVSHVVGLPLIPNYRYGEIRQALLRTAETKIEGLIEVTPWDFELKPWIPQVGITEQQKQDLAQHLVRGGMNRDYAMLMFLGMPCGAALTFNYFVSWKGEVGPITKMGLKAAAFVGGVALATSIMYLAFASATHKRLAANYLIKTHDLTLPVELAGQKLNSWPVAEFIMAQISPKG
jgi:hypothetical protein